MTIVAAADVTKYPAIFVSMKVENAMICGSRDNVAEMTSGYSVSAES
jgi:hypothetical protein